ncbi:MAG TPA: MFS transporter [Candidatus Dormibacteraeota bacterium]|nr:MFS transporter [Candidatus Dormibacteraeota bacterium]
MPAGDSAIATGQRWLMWGLPALIFLIAFLHRAAPGVIAKDLMQAFNATGATLGLISAMYFYAYAGFMVPGGLLIDALGPRWVVAAGGAVMGVGSVAMGLAPTPTLLFGGRLLVGLGAAVTFTGTLKIAANWFPASHFGTMSAISATVGVLGALVGSAPLAMLVAALSWRGALIVIGAISLAVAALCALIVRDEPRGAVAPAASASMRDVAHGTLRVLRNPYTWPPFVCFFFLYASIGNFFLWGVPYLRDVYGLTTTRAAFYASLPSMALLASGPLTGYLSDRVLRRRAPAQAPLRGADGRAVPGLAHPGADPRPPTPGGRVPAPVRDGPGRHRLHADVADRARGESTGPGRDRGGGRQSGGLRGRGAHPGPGRRRPRRALAGRDAGRGARVSDRGLPRRVRDLRALRADRGRRQPVLEGDAGGERLSSAPSREAVGKRAP